MATATNRKQSAKNPSRAKTRASWRGQLRFGLVSFEVQAINAEIKENAEVHFHLLHRPDRQRIHYAKICPKHGEVPNDEIVEGYEVAKGQYVEFDKEELDELRTDRERALSLDAFLAADELDPIYFDGRMYYLVPSGVAAGEPYALLETAMVRQKRWGIGQVVFSGREQLALVRPLDGVLTMAMLNYDAEIRKPSEIKSQFTQARTEARKLRLAEQLIGEWETEKFNFGSYHDRYREKIKQAIEAKRKGEKLQPADEEEPEVINLMDALKQSVARAGRQAENGHARGKSTHRRKPTRQHRRRA